MMYPVKNNNYTQQTKDLLLYQFSNSPNIIKLIEIYSDELQLLENEYFLLLESLGINTAVGYALDIIGKEVGEQRQGKNDADYRSAIITKIFVNNASGTPEEVIASTLQITGATSVKYSEQYPATAVLEVLGAEYVSKAPVIRKTLPAAVDLVFERNMELDQTQTYVGVAYSFIKDFESNPI